MSRLERTASAAGKRSALTTGATRDVKGGTTIATRTPLRSGAAILWVDTGTGTVRFGAAGRNRTLMAGLAPAAYALVSVVGGGLLAWVFDPNSDEGWQFTPSGGVAAAVRILAKPAWCAAVESTLPPADTIVPTWLEVGVDASPTGTACSIPLGKLPLLQAALIRYELHLTYITQISEVERAR